jgi:DNA-binding CsgD family transcriptional regulator
MNNNKKPLTDREMQILKLIVTDKNNIEIAEVLNLSANTVVTHRKNIMRKLEIKSAIGLLRWAIANKMDIEI